MQAGIGDEVIAGGGGNGGDITDVLHHGSDGDGSHDQHGGHVELGDDELLEADQVGLTHGGEVHQGLHDAVGIRQLGTAGGGDDRHNVAAYHAQQDGDDLHHALAPDIGHHDDGHGHQGQPPAGGGVFDGGAGEVQADHDDHGAGDDGGEVTHDRLGPQHLKEQSQHQIQETGDDDAAQSVGQLQFGVQPVIGGHGGHGGEAAQVGKGGTKESGDLELGAHMEQQGAQTGHQQGGLDAQGQAVALNQNGHQHGGAKHGEQMLQA